MKTIEKADGFIEKNKIIQFIGSNKIMVSQYVIIILLCYIVFILLDINNTLHSTLWDIKSIPSIENKVSDIHNQVVPEKSVWDR